MLLPRMTTRQWMIAVAVVAALLGGAAAHQRWEPRALAYQQEFTSLAVAAWEEDVTAASLQVDGQDVEAARRRGRAAYYRSLAAARYRAICYPWLHVPPDPPEPK